MLNKYQSYLTWGLNQSHIQRKNIEDELTNKNDILVICGTNDVVVHNFTNEVLTAVQATLDQLQEDTPVILVSMTIWTGLVLIKKLGRQIEH